MRIVISAKINKLRNNNFKMDDSESFTSLMDLVNSHLSKTSLNTSQSGEGSNTAFPLASVRIQTGMSQTVFTPPNGIMSIPRLATQDNEINGILAQQVTNMLIAKEKRKQEEEEEKKRKLEEQKRKEQKPPEDDYVIDLMSSIIVPKLDQTTTNPSGTKKASSSSSFESVLSEVEDMRQKQKTLKRLEEPKECLPLNQDMSYMLERKVRRGKPSAFCKVISARLRPVAAPYFKVEINNPAVVRFDFSTKSPCDINLEKRLHPPHDPYAHMNMVERFMAQTNHEGHHAVE